ncbi:hypothetical protein CHS0354_014576 [Potamilus streckersoni]|uniref:EF-hand domain-containing protein n=1 Tax=Potamilus streckersoni TaxID=2493646 RepID=A0AAE0RNJ4_9BIVA|nr:hypothetical protein CHS0354_014576 [Potamilus streckersoni]
MQELDLCILGMDLKELEDQDVETIKEFFCLFDQDNDGCITFSEIECVLKCVLVRDPTPEEIKEYMEKFDQDGSGAIEFDEFLTLTKSMPTQSLKKIFKSIDTDNDGHITMEEMKELLRSLDQTGADEKVERFVRKADKDGDEKISYEEFVHVFAMKK